MAKFLTLTLTAGLLLASCSPETPIDNPPRDSGEPECSWIMPENWGHMSRDEYERWLRLVMPGTPSGCELTDEQIRRIMETLEEDQVRKLRWEKHFEMIDVMANIRAEYRQIAADEFISPVEDIFMCQRVRTWRTELDGVITFMDDYRRADPEHVQANPSLTTLESETQKLLIWVDSVETRCGVN